MLFGRKTFVESYVERLNGVQRELGLAPLTAEETDRAVRTLLAEVQKSRRAEEQTGATLTTYVYQDDLGEEHEVSQRMTEPAFTHRTEGFEHKGERIPGRWLVMPEFKGVRARISDDDGSGNSGGREVAYPVKRVISASSGGFRLVSGKSGGWSSTGYSKPENARYAEKLLGRPLVAPNGGK